VDGFDMLVALPTEGFAELQAAIAPFGADAVAYARDAIERYRRRSALERRTARTRAHRPARALERRRAHSFELNVQILPLTQRGVWWIGALTIAVTDGPSRCRGVRRRHRTDHRRHRLTRAARRRRRRQGPSTRSWSMRTSRVRRARLRSRTRATTAPTARPIGMQTRQRKPKTCDVEYVTPRRRARLGGAVEGEREDEGGQDAEAAPATQKIA
jgi:hypothetical protein